MNEVFETLSDVFEELCSESEDREYSVQTEEAKAASRELKKKRKVFEAYLSKLPKEDREFLEDYMDAVDPHVLQTELPTIPRDSQLYTFPQCRLLRNPSHSLSHKTYFYLLTF